MGVWIDLFRNLVQDELGQMAEQLFGVLFVLNDVRLVFGEIVLLDLFLPLDLAIFFPMQVRLQNLKSSDIVS